MTNGVEIRQTPWTRTHGLLFAAILLAYVLIVWQALQAPLFVLDDGIELAYVRSHPTLAALWQRDCFLYFRPAKNLCFLAFNAIQPFGLAACRLLAIAIGLGSAVAVLAMFRRLLRAPAACLAATACWLLAPTMVSVTVWLSCVNILLMTGMAAVSILLYLEGRERAGASGTVYLVGSWLTSLLAMLCYEGAVCLPGLVVLIDFFLFPERLRSKRSWRVYAGLLSALVLYLLLRAMRGAVAQQILCGNFGDAANWQIVVAAPWFFFQHLWSWLWPFERQAVIGGYCWREVSPLLLGCAWLGALALAAGCWLLRRLFAMGALGVAWCLVAFLPMSNLLAFRNGPYGDYYLALSGMGLALAFGWAIGQLAAHGPRVRGALLALVALSLWRLAAVGEGLAWSYAWNDPGELLQRTLRTFPQAFSAMNEYGRLLYCEGAIDACQAWADRASAIAPHNRDSYVLRVLVAERHGNIELARQQLDHYMQCGGETESWGWYFKGYILDEHLGDTNGAIRCYQQAIANRTGWWSPEVLDSMGALAFFAAQRGDRHEAIDLWEQVLRVEPGRNRVRQNLVRAYHELGDEARAKQHWILLQKNH